MSSNRTVNGHVARKRFGQNFLHDAFIISQIVDAVSPQAGEHIVEIGPGMGAITQPLLQQIDTQENATLTVLELDKDLAAALRLNVGALDNPKLNIIETNALDYDFAQLADGNEGTNQNINSNIDPQNRLRIVGNLPYNISTPLLFHLMEYAHLITDMHFMLQKEVVQRITATPNSKTYGRLSVMMQYAAKPTFLFDVPRGAFNPAPKVTSAVFRLLPYAKKPIQAKNEAQFATVVRMAFNQRRKTLRAIFKKHISAESMAAAGITPTARPENLSVADFVALANAIEKV